MDKEQSLDCYNQDFASCLPWPLSPLNYFSAHHTIVSLCLLLLFTIFIFLFFNIPGITFTMSFLSFLLLLGAFQGIAIALILVFNPRKRNQSTYLLAFLLINSSGYLLFEYFVFAKVLLDIPHLIGVYLPALFLIPPNFYLLLRSEVDQEFGFKWKQLSHLAPSILVIICMMPYYLRSAIEKQQVFIHHTSAFTLYPYAQWFAIGLFFISVFYAIFSLQLFYDKNSMSKKKKWLKNYTYVFIVILVIVLISQAIVISFERHPTSMMVFSVVAFSALIHFVGYSAIYQSNFLNTTGTALEPHFSNIQKEELKSQILNMLEDEKAYLKSNLSSDDFCNKLEINKRYLSHFINQEFNCSLTYLVNSYRVTMAKKMLLDKQYDHLNFVGIASKAGFSNKDSFTRTFKRHEGLTPSSFRKNQSL